MRETEFRAWDRRGNRMVSVKSIDFGPEGVEVLVPMASVSCVLEVLRDFDLVQFTGLRDLRGVKIFEGDFLRDRLGRIFEVFWMAGVTEYDMEAGWWVRKHEGDCREAFTMHQWRDNKNLGYEVAGNVYENPELLGGKP